MAVVDEAGTVLRQIDQFDGRCRAFVGHRLGLAVHRQARLAIAGAALFGRQSLEHVGDVDFLVEGDPASPRIGPDDLAADHDRIGKRDLQLFADGDRNIGRQHHAAIGNVADPPQARVAVAHHLGDPPDRAIAIAFAAIGARGNVLLLYRTREATLTHLIPLIDAQPDRSPSLCHYTKTHGRASW